MSIPTHENMFVKNCLNCGHEITDLNEEHLFCTQCGCPIRNECTGTAKYLNRYSNEQVAHDFDEDVFVLKPTDVYCPKCGTVSLFAKESTIEVKHPKVDVIDPPLNGDLPY